MYRGKFELFTLSDKSASLAFPKVGYLLAMVVDVLLPDQARFSNVPQFTHSMALVWTINLRTNHLPLRGACNLHEAQESIWESYHASPCITVFWKKKNFSWSPFKLSSMSSQVDGWRANSVSNQEVFAAAKPRALPLWRCKELSKVMMVLKNTYVRNWWLKNPTATYLASKHAKKLHQK